MADRRVLSGENVNEYFNINGLSNDAVTNSNTLIDYGELVLDTLKRRKNNKRSCDTLAVVEDSKQPEDRVRRSLENLVQANLVVQKQYKGKLTYTPVVIIENSESE